MKLLLPNSLAPDFFFHCSRVTLIFVFLSIFANAAPPQSPLELAKTEIKAGRHGSAEKLLTVSLQSDPRGADADERYFLLGQSLSAQNRTDEALRTFAGMVSRFPNTEWAAQAIEMQATLHIARKNPSEAQKLRDQLLERYPKSPTTSRVWGDLADELFQENKFKESVAIYRQLEDSLSPRSTEQFQLAETLSKGITDTSMVLAAADTALKKNQVSRAKTLLKIILDSGDLKSGDNSILVKYAWCIYLEGGPENLTEAEKIWTSIARKEPKSETGSASRWHLVQLHAGPKQEWEKAVKLCALIAADMPSGSFRHEQALFTRAWLLRTHKDWPNAKQAFAELIANYPAKASHEPVIGYIEEIEEALLNPQIAPTQ